jgi:allophanate hydrolase
MTISLLVIGAHLRDQPLHGQLMALQAQFRNDALTSARYRLYLLPGEPAKPGLERVADDAAGISVPGELYELSDAAFGTFVAAVPPPLAIGPVELASGLWSPGFLCQHHALRNAQDISAYGGWREWLQR